MPNVKLTQGGPYLVEAGCGVLAADGTLLKEGPCALCACGKSATKPFCDGSHRQDADTAPIKVE